MAVYYTHEKCVEHVDVALIMRQSEINMKCPVTRLDCECEWTVKVQNVNAFNVKMTNLV